MHTGGHLLGAKVDQGLPVGQQSSLSADDIEITIDSQFVTVSGQGEESFRGFDGCILALQLFREDAQRGQVIFDLLEGGQNSLAIARDCVLVAGARLFDDGLALAGIENRLRQSRANRPNAAGPFEQAADRGALDPGGGAESDGRIIGGFGDADLRVGLGHTAFGSGDVRAAFEQFGGDTDGRGRRTGFERLGGNGEIGGGFADQQGDGVLELGPQDAEIDGLRLGCFELGLGLRDIFIGSSPGLKTDPGQAERFPVGGHGLIKQILERVLRAQFKVVHRHLSVGCQSRVFEIGNGRLSFRSIGIDRIADAPPKIELPRGVQRRRQFRDCGAGGRRAEAAAEGSLTRAQRHRSSGQRGE